LNTYLLNTLGFTNRPVTEWSASKSYQEINFFVNSVKVINDAEEREIKLNSDYAALLTDDLVQ